MSKWLQKLLEKEPLNRTDKTDRFDPKMNMSVLSVPFEGPFGKNLGNMSETRTDKTDRFDMDANMSVLSGPSYDSSKKISFYPFEGDSLIHNFEERIAIAEYDGSQTSLQAQCIAYQDAFIATLNALRYEDTGGGYKGDWFDQRIKAAKEWLWNQGLQQPK